MACAAWLLIACCSAMAQNGQVIDLRDPLAASSPEIDQSPVETDEFDSGQSQHERTLADVRKIIESDENLRPFEKRRALRKLNRPRVALEVTDYVTSSAIAAGVIDIPPPPMWSIDPDQRESIEVTEMAIDRDKLFEFIKWFLPKLIELLGMFGG